MPTMGGTFSTLDTDDILIMSLSTDDAISGRDNRNLINAVVSEGGFLRVIVISLKISLWEMTRNVEETRLHARRMCIFPSNSSMIRLKSSGGS